MLRSISMYIHADATTPAGSGGCTVASSPLDGGLPRNTAGSAPAIWSFEACSAFTHVSACMFAESPKAIRFIRGFDGFVTSSSAPTATGWNDPSPGGNCTHWKSPPLHGAQYFDLTRLDWTSRRGWGACKLRPLVQASHGENTHHFAEVILHSAVPPMVLVVVLNGLLPKVWSNLRVRNPVCGLMPLSLNLGFELAGVGWSGVGAVTILVTKR